MTTTCRLAKDTVQFTELPNDGQASVLPIVSSFGIVREDVHSGGSSRSDTNGAVFHDGAVGGVDIHSGRCFEEQIGFRLPNTNLIGAVNSVGSKKLIQTSDFQIKIAFVEWCVGRETIRLRQSGQ